MAGVKRVKAPSSLNWKGNDRNRENSKGIKPLPDPMSLKMVPVMLVMHLCRKYVLITTWKKLIFYAAELVVGSLLHDFFPLPKIFFTNKGNILNKYFAKFSWGWTFLLVGLFTALTSNVYCCGNRQRVRRHLLRLAVGTGVWFLCTQAFVAIESWSGACVGGGESHWSKEKCLKHNYIWKSFDISGHSFLLIYCCLLIAEEAKAVKGWDRINDLIREESYDEDSVLKTLTKDELSILKILYEKYDKYVKVNFVGITLLSFIWDITLVGTVLYYHTMAQKVAGGLVAIAMWFITYRVWYNLDMSPGLPGQGPFKYYLETKVILGPEDRRRSLVGGKPSTRPPLRPVGLRNGAEFEHVKVG